ncbi:MAG: hypothetical protein ABH839_02775 [Chloroflexota bacterium]
MAKTQGAYPATLSVDYSDGKRNRLTSFSGFSRSFPSLSSWD